METWRSSCPSGVHWMRVDAAPEIDPASAEGHSNLGAAYGDRGLQEEAISEFRAAIEIDPESPEAHFNLGVAHMESGQLEDARRRDAGLEGEPLAAFGRRRRRRGTRERHPERLADGNAGMVVTTPERARALAKRLDPAARELRKWHEDEVDAVIEAAHEQIARARFAAFGTGLYPDATFTLRLSYGSVRGWDENGAAVEPLTVRT